MEKFLANIQLFSKFYDKHLSSIFHVANKALVGLVIILLIFIALRAKKNQSTKKLFIILIFVWIFTVISLGVYEYFATQSDLYLGVSL